MILLIVFPSFSISILDQIVDSIIQHHKVFARFTLSGGVLRKRRNIQAVRHLHRTCHAARSVYSPWRANGANGMSDIEGKVAREAMSECGQRASFNISE